MNHYYFAQAYGAGDYGNNTYQCTDNCGTATQQPSGPLAPNTGFFSIDNPSFVVPSIIIAAVLAATLILIAKKAVRRLRRK